MRLRLFLFVLAMASLATLTFAQTPDPKDNACYPGGSMEGRCENELHWNAGWYRARWESKLITRDDIPFIYQWVVPAPPPVFVGESESGSGSGGSACYASANSSILSFGPVNEIYNALFFSLTTDCTTLNAPTTIITAADAVAAQQICDNLFVNAQAVVSLVNAGYSAPTNLYACFFGNL